MFESVVVSGQGSVSAVVVGIFADKKLDGAGTVLDKRYGRVLTAALARAECSGEAGKVAEAYPPSSARASQPTRFILLGLGKKDAFTPSVLRNAAAALGRRLAVTKDQRVSIDLAGPLAAAKADLAQSGRCFGEGLGLVAWNYDACRGKGSEPAKRTALAVRSESREFERGMSSGLMLAKSTNVARDLSQAPPNIATTSHMAARAKAIAKEAGLTFRIWEGAALEKENFAGLINVGKASENKPCMMRLEYRPKAARRGKGAAAADAKPIVLVGKTMTYDTGGLSLKINNGMVGMKRDKDGGCAVLGAMHAIGTLIKPDRPVVALLACAENSISDEAYRPDDVIRFRNGVTVEVTNTDAEGRLVLAAARCWACDQEDPACIIDLATLTGGVVTALGSTFAGLWCDDDALRAKLEEAMKTSGERWWRLPHDAEYREMMKSPIADILNSNPNRKAHPIQGAAFLSYFVKPGVPWCHIDIAGVHAVEGDAGMYSKGPTGWGVRLLADLLAQ